jgi:hypothetical protein
MAGTNVKRSLFKTFLNTATYASPTFSVIGDGVASAAIAYNPASTSEVYIDQDTATITVDSYAPTMAVKAKAKNTDPAFEWIDTLRKSRGVGATAETDIVNVWMYETGGPTAYPAERQLVSVQIDDFGGDGGKMTEMGYTINFRGDRIAGTFNSSTLAFTAT